MSAWVLVLFLPTYFRNGAAVVIEMPDRAICERVLETAKKDSSVKWSWCIDRGQRP